MRISDWSSDVCSSDLDPFQPVVCGMGSRGAPSPRRIECRCQTGSRSRRKAARARTAAMTGAPDLDAMTAEEFVAYLDDLDRAEKPRRSEEHTSELQSLMRTSYAVFCLQNTTTNLHTDENLKTT